MIVELGPIARKRKEYWFTSMIFCSNNKIILVVTVEAFPGWLLVISTTKDHVISGKSLAIILKILNFSSVFVKIMLIDSINKARSDNGLLLIMKLIILWLLPAVLLAVTMQYSISDFTKVSLSGPFPTNLVQNGTTSLRISADSKEILDRVVVQEGNSTLYIWLNNTNNLNIESLKVQLSGKKLEGLAVSGVNRLSSPALKFEPLAIILADGNSVVSIGDLQANNI